MRMEGLHGLRPVIERLRFTRPEKIIVELRDGREIVVPLKYFPSINKMTPPQRRQYQIVNDEIIVFKHINEVYHTQDFLGKELEYRYAPSATPRRATRKSRSKRSV